MKKIIFSIVCALGISILCSCDDGDSFTTSPNNALSFSSDTIKFDTVFSTVPSSTRSFWVYNKSGDGLRCSSVRLEGGNQSGFRVNVDGAYLSSQEGYRVNDIEVRDKDSIRVYVELTSATTNKSVPVELNDNLVFNLESGRQQKVALNAWSWDALQLRNCTISKDSTLSGTTPIIVYGKLQVDEGATLTIVPGTTLYFHDGAGIDLKGRIVCNGTPGANITLRGDRLDRMFDYLPYDRVSGQWNGIHIAESSYDNEISFTDLHGSFDGIVVDSSDVARNTLSIYNSTVHNCQGYGVSIVNSKATISDSQLSNTLYNCLAVEGGDVSVRNTTIAQFYPFDSSRGYALYISGNTHPLVSFDCKNSLVTGYSNVEMKDVEPSEDSGNAYNYSFSNCILRMAEVGEEKASHFVDIVYEDVKDTVKYGRNHFVKVDGDMQLYDFRLRKESAAVDTANPATATSSDRCGNKRDDKPDIGAFEYIKSDESN